MEPVYLFLNVSEETPEYPNLLRESQMNDHMVPEDQRSRSGNIFLILKSQHKMRQYP